jgi:hypothetical protein
MFYLVQDYQIFYLNIIPPHPKKKKFKFKYATEQHIHEFAIPHLSFANTQCVYYNTQN